MTKEQPTITKPRLKAKGRKASLKTKRETAPAVSVASSGKRNGLLEALTAAEMPQAINLPVEIAKIKLDVSSMTPQVMLDELSKVNTGMAATPDYAGLPVLADVQGARTALSTQLANLQNLEMLIKEARVTLGQWEQACGVVLNRAAVACENANSDPAVLINGGWTLRRGRTPSQDMPPPTGLKMKQTGFAGKGAARWKSVPNAHYYEVLVAPVVGAPLTIAEPVTVPTAKVEAALPPVAPGTLVTICVRAVGAKGAGPFCDGLVARVN